MGIPMIAMFFCGGSSVTSNSRMLWSFSRDGALPGYKLWSSVNPWTKTPVNAVIFMVILAFILGLPMLSSNTAFAAVISISTIGLYISCEWPAFLLSWKRKLVWANACFAESRRARLAAQRSAVRLSAVD